MRKTQVMNIVLLPQAVKIMLPAIISQCVVALKDTSLGYAIVAPGLTAVGKPIYTEFGNQVPTVLVIAAIYIMVNLLLTALATWVQTRLVGEKKILEVPMVGDSTAAAGALAHFFGVTQSLMTPSMTTVPSSRTPLTRTPTSGSSPVHCSGSVSATAGDVAGGLGRVGDLHALRDPALVARGSSPRPARPSRPPARCRARSRAPS